MFRALTNLLDRRRDRKELEQIRRLALETTLKLEPLTIIKIGNNIRRILEDETREIDLADDDESMDRMRLDGVVELATEYGRLGDQLPETEQNLSAILAMRFLSGWLRCKIVARRSTQPKIIYEARELEHLYFGHIKNCLHAVRGEPMEAF